MKKLSSDHPNFTHIGRRKFVSLCGACTACMAAIPVQNLSSRTLSKGSGMIRIRIVYSLHEEIQDRPDWPNVGYDFRPFMHRINQELSERLEGFEFLSTMANGPEEAEKIVREDAEGDVDGYLVYQLNCWNRVVHTLIETGKPVLYADFQYGGSGGFLVYNANFIRKDLSNVGFVSSSDIRDLIESVKCFRDVKSSKASFSESVAKVRQRNTPIPGDMTVKKDDVDLVSIDDCIKQIKGSKILAVRDTESATLDPIMDIPIEKIPFAEVNNAYKNADREEAREIANQWIDKAEEVREVPEQTIIDSAAMYLGMKSILKDHRADAITINCLGGFYGGHIHAYPCLGFYELNNEGLVGACECDLESTATMVAFNKLTSGRPGYISDPVIDTSRRQIIYAHCVGSNKVFGPEGKSNPYSIMTHSEDRQGASVRSIMPLGYMTTSLKIKGDRKEIIFHQAKAIHNDPDDRACRTKLCAEPVGDLEKLFGEWDHWGWHRVTFYGEFKEAVFELAARMGYRVIEEV